jgi:CBS-domain-containing membrane protein
MKNKMIQLLGIEQYRAGHKEKLISALGAFLGIALVFYSSTFFVHGQSSYLIVASMGASAVLLFAVPHGPLSQPWAVIGGHLISAVVGVSCAKLIPDIFFAAPAAVGIAVGLMYYLNCIHPPGGATALSAVVGGNEVMQLGYQFVLTPVLINVVAIISVAVAFNFLFQWRRYPAYLARLKTPAKSTEATAIYEAITHEDFVYALSEFDSFIDVSESDLLTIYDLVTKRHHGNEISYSELKNGHYYSNGEYGDLWSVRQIIDWSEADDSGEEKLIYKAVAGAERRNTGVMTKNEFSRWARHEVMRDEENWRRVDNSTGS